jgi:putative oxidoreductase
MSQSANLSHFTSAVSVSNVSASVTALLGRVLISAIFILSGISKLTAPAMMIGYIQSVGLPFPSLALGLAVLIEIVGGVALVLGFQTRIVAAILALFTVVTALAFHSSLGDQNQFIHFFKNIAMTGGLLQVLVLGAGQYSLDARRQ